MENRIQRLEQMECLPHILQQGKRYGQRNPFGTRLAEK